MLAQPNVRTESLVQDGKDSNYGVKAVLKVIESRGLPQFKTPSSRVGRHNGVLANPIQSMLYFTIFHYHHRCQICRMSRGKGEQHYDGIVAA